MVIRSLCLVSVLSLLVPAGASAATYTQTLDVYEIRGGLLGDTANWTLSYDHSADPIDWVRLTIVADDVDLGEQVTARVRDPIGNWHLLGDLVRMDHDSLFGYLEGPGNPDPTELTTTVFNVNPAYLGGTLPVRLQFPMFHWTEIETLTLTVASREGPDPNVVCEPASLLGLLSMAAVGGLIRFRRRRA